MTATMVLLNTKVIPRTRDNCRTDASYYSKPKLHIFIKDWNVLADLQGERWNKPHNEFKRQVLNQALTAAGFDPEKIKVSWSQKAGCSCGCSPGFILNGVDDFNPQPTPPVDIYCDYDILI
jgi:hypothetical protein